MNNPIKLPRVESRAPQKNSIEWEIPNQATFVYVVIQNLGHAVVIKVKKAKRHWWNSAWETKMIQEKDGIMVIAKGLDFLEQYGYTLDNRDLSFREKMSLGMTSLADLKIDTTED